MKKLLWMLSILMMGLVSFTACGDDEEDVVAPTIPDLSKIQPTFDIVSTGETLSFSMEYQGIVKMTITPQFNDQTCVSQTIVAQWANEELAKGFVYGFEQEKAKVQNLKRNGSVVTFDDPNDFMELGFIGMSYEFIMEELHGWMRH